LCVTAGRFQTALTSTVAVVRDIGTMGIGFWIFIHEESHRPSDWGLLLSGIALIGGPAALQFVQLLRAARDTGLPSSPRPEEPPRPPSSPPS
jgi:hypothetical protein